jgi:aspartate aminotransferase-like enzyme
MQKFLETTQNVILFPSSGTGFMEASVRNGVSLNGKVLVTIIGAFGHRYADVVQANGREAIRLSFDLGEPVNLDRLSEALDTYKDVEAVTVTYNETSTGVLNPLKEIAEVVNKYDKLIFVDAVSAMGAADIKFDKWKLDLVFSSSQKAFGIPPGLAFAAVSDRLLEIARKIPNKGWYFDLNLYVDYSIKKKSTPTTPPIPQIMGLNVMLKKILQIGKHRWLKMYEDRAKYIREKLASLKLKILAKKGFESPTITVVFAPDGYSGTMIYQEMRKRGFELAMGYGELKDKTFRIGHMGDISYEDIDEMFRNLEDIIKRYGCNT